MGDTPASVVNAALQVHGIAGLRVADASVLPAIPRAHPNATVMMIAEKASDMLLGRTAPEPIVVATATS